MSRKVLHIVGSMARGGVETWLMHVMRNIDREFEFHFFVNNDQETAYDQELVALGGRIHYGGRPGNPSRYAKQFAAVNRQHGPFTVLHSHVYWYSGFVTRLGYEAGIPVRIAHSHSATSAPRWKLHRQTYQAVMRSWIMRYSTHRVAASQGAAQALFGRHPERPVELIYCGMDFSRFLRKQSLEHSKRQLGIPPERKVIGQVGRFMPVKNHKFTLEVFERTLESGLDTHLLLVGDGPLLPDFKIRIEARGLSGRCTLAGLQNDVVPYFAAMDAFLFPSLWEGLGLVAVESQAAGVPVIASTGVPEEVEAIPGLVERVPLESGAEAWSSALSRAFEKKTRCAGDEPMRLQDSRFGLPRCLDALSRLYSQESVVNGPVH